MAAGMEWGASSQFTHEIAVLTAIQLTITIISSLFANYLLSNITFVSNSISSFKIFSVVYFLLAVVLLLRRTKRRFTLIHLLKLPLFIGCCAVLFHGIAVLYGAPLWTKIEETSTFGLVIAMLTCLPLCCVLGVEIDVMYKVLSSKWFDCTIEAYFQSCVLFTLLGAWLGAIPIPLDWDRPWQVWPITCVVGGIIGYIVGLLTTGIVFWFCYKEEGRKRL